MKISVASSIGDIEEDVAELGAEVVVVLRGTLGRLDVLDGATVVIRFCKDLYYIYHATSHNWMDKHGFDTVNSQM